MLKKNPFIRSRKTRRFSKGPIVNVFQTLSMVLQVWSFKIEHI